MKKIIAMMLVFVIAFSLCSCTAKKRTALEISGTQIDEEIFAYFVDIVVSHPDEYGLDPAPSAKEIKAAATELCKQYITVNTIFSQSGIKLSAAEKVSVSQRVNNLWIRFENHYKSIGVSKQTLNKIETEKAYYEAAFSAQYDLGTSNEQYETIVKNYFYSNYVVFCTVCAYFTSANGTEMSQLEKNELAAKIDSLTSTSSDEDAFSTAASQAGFTASGSIVLKKGAEGYPDGFYEKIAAQKDGTVEIYTYDECIFAVLKENLKEKGEATYANYRSVCIKDIYAGQFDDLIEERAAVLTVNEKRAAAKIVDKVRRAESQKP